MIQESSQTPQPSPDRTVRCFWHGPFSPYEALCLSSFLAAGITVEVFSDGPVAGLPAGAVARDAREILNRDVAFYRHEFDGPSPSLHSNHFRYALLEQLGGWWIDTDVLLLAPTLPAQETFLARQADEEVNGAVMRFPPAHPLIAAARRQTEDRLERATWGDVGPKLLTALRPVHAPDMPIAPRDCAYAIGPEEFQKFLLPEAREEVEARTANATFAHLWNEMWRRAGIPKTIAPPRGSWLDAMFERFHPAVTWSDRLDAEHVARWAGLRRDRDHAGHYNFVHDQEIKRLRAELEQERRKLRDTPSLVRRLMARLDRS